MHDLVPLHVFGQLRLRQFVPPQLEVHEFGDWEYMEDRWVGEGVGAFTEFLRLEESPDVVRAVTLDLVALPTDVSRAILSAVGLPLWAAMPESEVLAVLGPPLAEQRFIAQRVTYEFSCGRQEPYRVLCTLDEAQGLVHVAVLASTPRRLAAEDLDQDA